MFFYKWKTIGCTLLKWKQPQRKKEKQEMAENKENDYYVGRLNDEWLLKKR